MQAVPDISQEIISIFQGFQGVWLATVLPHARRLFFLLATIDFGWTMALLSLQVRDLHSWAVGLIRTVMRLGAFLILLNYGPQWLPSIVASFETIGQQASGTGVLSPGDVFARGIDIASSLLSQSAKSALLLNFGTGFSCVIACFLTFLSFVVISVQITLTIIESYMCFGVAMVFLGFGGSKWTSSYVERLIALFVSVGVKLMLLYLLVGAGMGLAAGWLIKTQSMGLLSGDNFKTILTIAGSALVFMALCWCSPQLFSAILGGAPVLGAGDIFSAGAGIAIGAATMGSMMKAAAQKVSAAASAASSSITGAGGGGAKTGSAAVGGPSTNGGGSSGGSSMPGLNGSTATSSQSNAVPPPSPSGNGSAGGNSNAVPPPSVGTLNGQPLGGPPATDAAASMQAQSVLQPEASSSAGNAASSNAGNAGKPAQSKAPVYRPPLADSIGKVAGMLPRGGTLPVSPPHMPIDRGGD